MDQILNDKINTNVVDKKEVSKTWQLIQKAETITLLTHYRPDGDGISACAALEHIFKKLHKKIETVYPCSSEFNFSRQSKKILINTHQQIPDLIIAIDTSTYNRLYYPDVFKTIPLINIDHHVSNKINGTINFIYADHSSACESLFMILESINQNLIDTYVAECLLVGILYDSLTFCTQATTARTLRIAAKLTDYGANLFAIQSELALNKTPSSIALWGKAMNTIQTSQAGTAAWIIVTQEDLKAYGLTQAALTGFINLLSQICSTDITILFYETDDGKTRVSFRSKKTDVNKMAAQFGGGGHQNAAGLLLNEPLPTVVQKVTAQL